MLLQRAPDMGGLWGLLETAQVPLRWLHCAVQASVPRRLVPGLRPAGGGGAAPAGSAEEPQPEVGRGRAAASCDVGQRE